jgi:hypothetical protein
MQDAELHRWSRSQKAGSFGVDLWFNWRLGPPRQTMTEMEKIFLTLAVTFVGSGLGTTIVAALFKQRFDMQLEIKRLCFKGDHGFRSNRSRQL